MLYSLCGIARRTVAVEVALRCKTGPICSLSHVQKSKRHPMPWTKQLAFRPSQYLVGTVESLQRPSSVLNHPNF